MKLLLFALLFAVVGIYFSIPPERTEWFIIDSISNMTSDEVIKLYNYPVEVHTVETEDGYLLNLIRIPTKESSKPPIFIGHGFMASSRSWLLLGLDSLPLKLHDEGYDVWLGDFRGNLFSLKHKTLNVTNPEFWDFSADHVGFYDVPAFVDHILNETGHDKLIHVGFSMGSCSFFMMNSVKPEYNEKVEAHIAMAPAVYMKHSRTWYEQLYEPLFYTTMLFEPLVRIGAYSHGVVPEVKVTFCKSTLITDYICYIIVDGVLGSSPSFDNSSIFESLMYNGLSGSSLNTAIQFQQFITSGEFKKFDYFHEEENKKRHNQLYPPFYDVSKTTVPVTIFHGETDRVITQKDAKNLFNDLRNPESINLVNAPFFNHGDFFISPIAKDVLYPSVIEKINEAAQRYVERKEKASAKVEENIPEVPVNETAAGKKTENVTRL